MLACLQGGLASQTTTGVSRQVEEETDQWLGKPASPQLGMPRSIGLANGRLRKAGAGAGLVIGMMPLR